MLSGNQLKMLRIKKDISQSKLANKIGIKSAYLSMLENQKQNIPDHIYQKWIQSIYLLETEMKNINTEIDKVEKEINDTEQVIHSKANKPKNTKSKHR